MEENEQDAVIGDFRYPEDAPDQLVIMRVVALGQRMDTEYGRSLKRWMKAKPIQFQEKLTDLELKYWASKKLDAPAVAKAVAMEKPVEGKACPCCGELYFPAGCERALEAAKTWLEANA